MGDRSKADSGHSASRNTVTSLFVTCSGATPHRGRPGPAGDIGVTGPRGHSRPLRRDGNA